MPAPTGQEALEERILLRLTKPEKAHLAQMAQERKMSVNSVLRNLITDDMKRASAPPAPPAPPAAPRPPLRFPLAPPTAGRRVGLPTFTEPAEIEGQTSILDDDQ